MNLELEFKIKALYLGSLNCSPQSRAGPCGSGSRRFLVRAEKERWLALDMGFTSLSLSPSSVQPNHSICIPLSNQYTQEAEEWIWESEMAQEFSENSSSLKKKLASDPDTSLPRGQ